MADLTVGRIEQLTHTPGPWRISTLDSRTVGPERGLTAHGTTITQLQAVARITERGTESEANARLIAAAPELLAALKGVLVGFEAGAFVRTVVDGDKSDWAIKLFPHLKALADAVVAVQKAEGH